MAAQRLQNALNAPNLTEEENTWTEIINEYGNDKGNWVPDLVGRAYSNRGNARSRRGDFQGAIEDYDKAMELCPWSVDPILNRGVVFERLGLFDLAIHDYRSVQVLLITILILHFNYFLIMNFLFVIIFFIYKFF